ncbi:MAG: DUF3105 domain-containing protein [Chloroflexota bacterium]|nr:MAG: DUF3105 domain-containing protein [Chloroflexota bacterium]
MSKRGTRRRQLASQSGDQTVRNIVIGGVVALIIIGLGALLYMSLQEPEALAELQRFVGLERAHDEDVIYDQTGLPPVGGIHSGIWQNCGIYDEPIVAKHAVHSMEHGAVWVTYQPGLPADDVEMLRDAVGDHSYALLSPYPDLRSPVVLTAWGIQLEVDSADDDRVATFLDRYVLGPQTPELGATCSNGNGTPIK